MSTPTPSRDNRSDGISVVSLDEVPNSEVLDLVRRSLGTGRVPRSEAFWVWKHQQGRFGTSPGLVAMDADGRAVGLRTFLPWVWRHGERRWRAARAVDTATDPAWRRMGIFRRLTQQLVARLAEGGAAFIFNTPNRQSLAGYLGMGWDEVGRVPMLARPLGITDRRRQEGTLLEPATQVLAAIDEPMAVARPGGATARLETPLDLEFLRWRYGRPPGLDYRAVLDREGGAVALVICRLRRRGRLREMAVADVLASPGSKGWDLARRTLRRTLAAAPAHYAVASAPRGTPERRLLVRCGLLPLPHRGPRLTVRRLSAEPELPDLRRWDTWRTMLGDLELF